MPDQADQENIIPKNTKGNILVVDDEADIRESLSILLSSAGYRVDSAENGKEGVHSIGAGSYDLVLLDLMMPDISGMNQS